MIRVVIDTNVVVSANLVDEGPSTAILGLAIDKRIRMFVSAAGGIRLKFDAKVLELVVSQLAQEGKNWPCRKRL